MQDREMRDLECRCSARQGGERCRDAERQMQCKTCKYARFKSADTQMQMQMQCTTIWQTRSSDADAEMKETRMQAPRAFPPEGPLCSNHGKASVQRPVQPWKSFHAAISEIAEHCRVLLGRCRPWPCARARARRGLGHCSPSDDGVLDELVDPVHGDLGRPPLEDLRVVDTSTTGTALRKTLEVVCLILNVT